MRLTVCARPHYARYRSVLLTTLYGTLWWPHTSTRSTIGLNYSLSTCHTITAWHPPDADGLVVASRCHHIRVARVPRNGVDGARMTRKHLRTLWIRL